MSEAASHRDGPYVGLIPYSEDDAQFFFGRESERDIINANLLGARLTVLYGLTGAGKTSVLRAGVEHQLKLIARENRERFGSPELAVVVFNKWKDDPLLNLRQDIKKSVEWALDGEGEVKEPSGKDLSETLEEYSNLLDGDILIILDQFEEYFLYHGRSSETSFSREFARAVNRASSHANFLISIREDALAKLDHFKGKIPELFSNYLRIEHLTSATARDAIEKPLEVFSDITHATPRFTIQRELVDEVCRQVRANKDSIADVGPGTAGADSEATQVETSFLQLVMARLWEFEVSRTSHHLRLKTLNKLGGADTIVQEHLNFNLIGFPEEEQRAAAAIFHYLVTPSGTKVAYTAFDLVQQTKLPPERVETVLEKLCAGDKRILRSYYTDRARRDVKSYEIYHDVLANAILGWSAWYQRDQERRRREREDNERREKEAERRREEEEIKRQEEQEEAARLIRRSRRRRLVGLGVLVGASFITAVSAILMIYALGQQKKAQEAAREANSQRTEAQRLLDIVNSNDKAAAFYQAVMRGHIAPVLGVAFSPDQARIVTASADRTARIWEARSGHLVVELSGHEKAVRSALYSPDGSRIATASDDRTARIWEATGRQLHVLLGHEGEVSAARFSDDSKFIVTASVDGTARVWEAATGRQTALLSDRSAEAAYAVTYAAFSPDGGRVVTGDSDGAVRVWEVESGSFTLLSYHASQVNTAVFSPDGKSVVTASSDGEARVWDAANGQSYALKGHKEPVNSAAFSSDGTLVVTTSDDKTARVWDLKTRQSPPKVLEGHTDAVLSASFSRDGVRVITASADKTARVWEVGSGRVLFELRGNADTVNQAVFSPEDGRLAATASADKTARTWNIGGGGGIRVTDATVEVKPDDYKGPCPVAVTISAKITAAGSGTITYRFVRTDGYIGTARTLDFERPGTQEVSTTWLFGSKASQTTQGRVELEIMSQPFQRQEAKYIVRCASRRSQDTTTPVTPPPPTPTPTPTPTPLPSGGEPE